ncbi:hypothetical protein HZF10_13510 [Flavobacterium sp. MAH-1]|uniref:Uncharacterized protein n=1 Tax=Flavobacterium agri TaxID=2743471 RepID=A0A7Y9C634_9FLAO|nr:hypothetical protein [Flavobacterium agri]
MVEYQTKFPIPKDNQKNRIYIYQAYFWRDHGDTIIGLRRSSGGILKNDDGYGVYRDQRLLPTVIYDDKNLGYNLILNKIRSRDTDKFYWTKGSQPESSPPIFNYQLKNNELRLMRIDTIWSRWD